MTQPDFDSLFGNLETRVDRLRSSPSEQRAYLTAFGVSDLADELALEFDDYYRPVLGHLDGDPAAAQLISHLAELDRALGDSTLSWNTADLASSPAWARVREIASHCLRSLREYRGRISA